MQAGAAEALADVADADASCRASMVQVKGLVASLMQMMFSDSSCVQEPALRALASVAGEPANRLLLGRQEGLLEQVVALLGSSSSDASWAAASAFRQLIREPEVMLRVLPCAAT
jgi:hypothetical protein